MPHRFPVDNGYWNWNFFTDHLPNTGPNQGPVVFRAVPKRPSQGGNNTVRNELVTYDFAMCRGGPGDDHAPEVFYEFKVRNDSSVAVPFNVELVSSATYHSTSDYLCDFGQWEDAMKITVITEGKSGKIVGATLPDGASSTPGSGAGSPMAGPGQSVRVLDLTHIDDIENVADIHAELQKHLGR